MAQTPWGELPLADAHVHFFSHAFYAGLARQAKYDRAEELGPLLGLEVPPPDPIALAARWASDLDRHGVTHTCLIASAPGDEDSVAGAVAASPERFFGHFMVDPTRPDAAERVRRAAVNPHLHCVCFFPAMHRYSMQDETVQPLLEVANESKLAVFVHCGTLSVGVQKRLGLPSPFDLRCSNPLGLHSVAVRFPLLRFLVPHFGAGFLREALMLADLCPNVWFDTSSSNRWMAYEGLDLRTVFRRCLDLVGPGRLLFGSDSSFFPRGWNAQILEQQTTALYELGLKKEEAAQILSTNLLQFHQPRVSSVAAPAVAARH